MHVVTLIRTDPDEVRHVPRAQVDPELVERHDVVEPCAARIVDIREVHERVVLLRVELHRDGPAAGLHRRGVLDVRADRRDRLHVRLPAQAVRLQLIDDVLTVEIVRCRRGAGDLLRRQIVAVCAVARPGDELLRSAEAARPCGAVVPDSLEVARHGRQVVGQAGMGHAEVVGRVPNAARQRVDEGCIRPVPDDLGIAVVLHHDVEDVLRRAVLALIALLNLC